MAACVLDMLNDDEAKPLRGRLLGSKNIRRTRKKIDNLWQELGCHARRAHRMSRESFDLLHDAIEPTLKEEFQVDVDLIPMETYLPSFGYLRHYDTLLEVQCMI